MTGRPVPTFEEYVAARGDSLVRLAWLIAGDRNRGDDLAQGVLARAFVRWRRSGGLGEPDLYVRRMVVNAHRSWWRRRTNRDVPVDRLPDRADAADHHPAYVKVRLV